MLQVFADNTLVYDSRLPQEYQLLSLQQTEALNKSGTLTLTMPHGHPAYWGFVNFKTIVTAYEDGALIFRGRSLYSNEDLYRHRTITCEGERGFFNDAIVRPYLFQDTPEVIFTTLIDVYNSQVEPHKRFVVGTITVTDANDYVRLESTTAEQVSKVLDKLVERCGGYIEFTTNQDGARTVNWLAELGYRSEQTIEFGHNLLDFARTEQNLSLVTVIIPYGAKDPETGERLTIKSVNNDIDYIEDTEAVERYGRITTAVYWDDVTEPANLKRKAEQYLNNNKNVITTLNLTAVDLSILDKSIDSFKLGDKVRVISKPHNIDEEFMLTECNPDRLNPANSRITLGKTRLTLTGQGVQGDLDNYKVITDKEHDLREEFTQSIGSATTETKQTLTALIERTAGAIRTEVSESYVTNDGLQSRLTTEFTQLSDSFNFDFTTLEKKVDDNDQYARGQFEEIDKHITFKDGNIILTAGNSTLSLRIENGKIVFIDDGAEVAYFNDQKLHVTDGHFVKTLQVGNIAVVPRTNGNTSIIRVAKEV